MLMPTVSQCAEFPGVRVPGEYLHRLKCDPVEVMATSLESAWSPDVLLVEDRRSQGTTSPPSEVIHVPYRTRRIGADESGRPT